MTTLTFLGTGNYLAQGRYWNSFVLDGSILVEPAPTVLPHLRRCGLAVAEIDVVFVSHFHADHTFGWPFLLLEAFKSGRASGRPLYVVGPPTVASFFHDMMRVGAVLNVHEVAHGMIDIRYVEVDGTSQEAGPVRFRAVEVEHVPHLRCFGYLIETKDGRTIGYSGDTRPCPGLDELAAAADVLVLECNGVHQDFAHMDTGSVKELRARYPDVPFVLTHVGEDVSADGMADTILPADFDTIEV